MIYEIDIKTSGRIYYTIQAYSEEDALEEATSMWEDTDFGPLEDLDIDSIEVTGCWTEKEAREMSEVGSDEI